MTITADLERQAERTRADLSSTLDELRGTVTRTAITTGATALAREGSATIARAAVRRASANPLAALLIGAGVCWLLAGSRSDGSTGTVGRYARRANEAVKGAACKIGDMVNQAGQAVNGSAEKASGMADQAVDAVTGAASSALAAGAGLADQARTGLQSARETAANTQERAMRQVHDLQDNAMRMTDRLTQLAEEQPILVAALAVAVGAAVGAALPTTDAERRYLGPSGARVASRGRDVAGHVVEAVTPMATKAAEAAGAAVASDVLGDRKSADESGTKDPQSKGQDRFG